MPEMTFDVIVVGLGGMGSAAAYHLARRGASVLGIDRFTPPHRHGSSHGESRIIREAYFEHPLYVPLVRRAYELWWELEALVGTRLMLETGGLMIGPRDGSVVSGALHSAGVHRLQHQVLNAEAVRKQFPVLQPSDDMIAVWEPRAGILLPEAAIATHLEQAQRHGAVLRYGCRVHAWQAEASGVHIETSAGDFHAKHLALCAGAWIGELTPSLRLPLTVERQVMHWFMPRANVAAFSPGQLPIYAFEYEPEHLFYGMANLGSGVKAGIHHQGDITTAEGMRRDVSIHEVNAMRALLRRYVPEADGDLQRSEVCLYTNTPDGHFLIDRHPQSSRVLLVSACSGHGFKFAPAMGEAVADLILKQRCRFDLSPFELKRLI